MMSNVYGFNPSPKHNGCLVDLLDRSGKLDEAHELAEPSASIFFSPLGACGS